jgi:hypothetical protein
MADVRISYEIKVGKSEGKRPLGTHRRGWEFNNTIVLREIVLGCGLVSRGSRWMPVASSWGNDYKPSGSIKRGYVLD